VRIISGILKARRFTAPKNFPSRPTTDFAKEGLFNILENRVDIADMEILDLCSGTGNISFEFVSRGAKHVLAIDSHPRCVQYLKGNIRELGIETLMQVYKSDCIVYCRNAQNVQYDLIFTDPPFHLHFHQELIQTIFDKKLLIPGGLVIVEHGKQTDLSSSPYFSFSRNFGNVYFSFLSDET
jgi:16S rRNA (guanine966-N2)-methyltransferase